jgi:hypothetical protein
MQSSFIALRLANSNSACHGPHRTADKTMYDTYETRASSSPPPLPQLVDASFRTQQPSQCPVRSIHSALLGHNNATAVGSTTMMNGLHKLPLLLPIITFAADTKLKSSKATGLFIIIWRQLLRSAAATLCHVPIRCHFHVCARRVGVVVPTNEEDDEDIIGPVSSTICPFLVGAVTTILSFCPKTNLICR